jgi:hypothetical protein
MNWRLSFGGVPMHSRAGQTPAPSRIAEVGIVCRSGNAIPVNQA